MTLLDIARLLQFVAAVTACALAWKRRAYRPVALLLVVLVIADWSRLLLDRSILANAPCPYRGTARAAFHVDQALFLTWPAGVAALAGWVFFRRRPWYVALAYCIAVAFLVIGYPHILQDSLARAYVALHILAFGYAVTCILQQLFKAVPEIEHATVSYAAVISLVALLGPYTGRDWVGRWNFAQVANAVLFTVLIYRQGRFLWNQSRSSPS